MAMYAAPRVIASPRLIREIGCWLALLNIAKYEASTTNANARLVARPKDIRLIRLLATRQL